MQCNLAICCSIVSDFNCWEVWGRFGLRLVCLVTVVSGESGDRRGGASSFLRGSGPTTVANTADLLPTCNTFYVLSSPINFCNDQMGVLVCLFAKNMTNCK